jgi:hypothetical protein
VPLPSIVTTPGATDANSYCSRADANQYHLERVPAGVAWANATDQQKDAALIYATRLLDSLFEWKGWVVASTQVLLWPRTGLAYPTGYAVPTNIIPAQLVRACAELARQLLVSDRMADSDVVAQGIKSVTAGPVSVTFDGTAQTAATNAVPELVEALIPPEWGYVRGRSSVVDLVRC